MELLLDTHALLWSLENRSRLSGLAVSLLTDSSNEVLVSAATAWELAIKAALGKLQSLDLVLDLPNYMREQGYTELPISVEQATRAGLLPLHHRDPFDRLLVAQAQSLNIPILSADRALDRYDVKRLW